MAPGTGSDYQKRAISLDGVEVEIESYRVGSRWGAKVQSADSGNSMGRGSGATREDAELAAIDSAKMLLDMRSAAAAFRTSAHRMRS